MDLLPNPLVICWGWTLTTLLQWSSTDFKTASKLSCINSPNACTSLYNATRLHGIVLFISYSFCVWAAFHVHCLDHVGTKGHFLRNSDVRLSKGIRNASGQKSCSILLATTLMFFLQDQKCFIGLTPCLHLRNSRICLSVLG